MANPNQVVCNVDALPGSDNYGDTTIVIPAGDEDRAEFLETCKQFFIEQGRQEDADKFSQAIKQTPDDPTDD